MKLRNPVSEVLTSLAALWSRISSAIGRGQAEAARKQQSEIDAALGVTPCWLAFGCKETHGK